MSKEISKEKTNSLLNCPFCGGELELHCTGRYYMHKLNGCILQHFCFETDDEERIKKWNTRKPMQNIVERLEHFNEETFYRANGRSNGKTLAYGYSQGIRKAIKIVKGEGGET